jgi:uncharacterized protein (TIGR02246 family)
MNAEAAIRQVIGDQAAAWNSGDAPGYAGHFAEDGSFTNVIGTTVFGHMEFEQRHVAFFDLFQGKRVGGELRRIQFVTPDVAIVDLDAVVRSSRDANRGCGFIGRLLADRLMQVFVALAGGGSGHHNVDVKASL